VNGFSQAWMTIKDGIIVQREGKMKATPKGSTHWVDAKLEPELTKIVETEIRERFQNSYTISFDNYPVSKRYLQRSAPVRIELTT